MAWRLYDTINGQWYNDALYTTQEACVEAANYYMREAHATGEVLELVAEPLDASEPLESVLEDMQEP
jgi:hypothetical protein